MTALVCAIAVFMVFGWLTAAVMDVAYMDERAARIIAESDLRATQAELAEALDKQPAVVPSDNAQVFAAWSYAAAGLDHVQCAGEDCARVLCNCPGMKPCAGCTDQACTHHNLLCDEHRSECTDCRLDAQHDAGFLG